MVHDWNRVLRPRALRHLVAQTADMKWNPRLMTVLLNELWIDDSFVELVGEPRRIRHDQYAQAVALAILFRYSWQPDRLAAIAKQLGVPLPTPR